MSVNFSQCTGNHQICLLLSLSFASTFHLFISLSLDEHVLCCMKFHCRIIKLMDGEVRHVDILC